MYKVNLLPDYLQTQGLPSKKWLRTVCYLLFILLLFLVSGFFYVRSLAMEGKLADRQAQLEQLKPQLMKIQKLKREVQGKHQQLVAFTTIKEKRLAWHPFLEDLPLALPADTWLSSVELKKLEQIPQGGGVVSTGQQPKTSKKGIPKQATTVEQQRAETSAPPVPNVMILTGNCWTMGSVGVMVDNLSLLAYFDSVQLVEANIKRPEGYIKFEIAAQIKGGDWDVPGIPKPQP